MAKENKTITIAAGTPYNVLTGMTSAQMLAFGFTSIPSKIVNELSIQGAVGGSGVVYVMAGIRGVTSPTQQWRVPSSSASTDLSATLAAASAAAPGGSFGDNLPYQGIDIATMWVDGAHTGDVVSISYDRRS